MIKIDDNFYIEITRTYDLVEVTETSRVDNKTKKPTGEIYLKKVYRGFHKDLKAALKRYVHIKGGYGEYENLDEYFNRIDEIIESLDNLEIVDEIETDLEIVRSYV